jgi:hypothetical protein
VLTYGHRLASADWRASIYDGLDRLTSEYSSPAHVSTSHALISGDVSVPSQVKLSLIPRGMAVSFSTVTSYPLGSLGEVVYGLSIAQMNHTATASIEESNTGYGTLFFHTVLLEELAPSTEYYYHVQGTAPSAVYSFKTAPEVGEASPFTVLIVGDMGLRNSANTIARMRAEAGTHEFILHIGDLSYADDFYLRKGDTYEGSWDAWQDEMEDITANTPYMSLPGNHEVSRQWKATPSQRLLCLSQCCASRIRKSHSEGAE